MIRLSIRLCVTILLITFLIHVPGLTSYSIDQEGTASVTGRFVDINGQPIHKLPLFIAPLEIINNSWGSTVNLPDDFSLLRRAQTDEEGRFSITGIPKGSFYFGTLPYNIDERLPPDYEKKLEEFLSLDYAMLHPDYIDAFIANNFGFGYDDFEPDVEILSLNVKGITFFPAGDAGEVVFGIEPGSHIKDVVVTVQPRMRVQGQVAFEDGTPLSNALLEMQAQFSHENRSRRRTSGTPRTDSNGSFVFYLDEESDTRVYTFSVKYQGLEATAKPVRLEPGERLAGLQFTFDSEPIAPKPLPPKTEVKPSKTNPKETQETQQPESNEVWIVNPVNRHAYKRVRCKTRDDAIAQALKEKAHLVTINDAKEQEWLSAVFGSEFYWIGLSKDENETGWQWQNGEAITYKNWLPDDYFSETWDANERKHVVTTFVDGKWYAVSPKSVIVKMTKFAIIEKGDIKILTTNEKASVKKK